MKLNREKLKELAISESGMIFSPETGSIFTTNQTGVTILNALKEGLEMDAVKERIIAEFEIESGTDMDKDMLDFIGQLVSLGLVERVSDD
jgi:hypothetical protein